MSVFPKTRAAAGYIAAAGSGELTAFTVLEAAASPPDPARADEICSRVLWARFAPGARHDPGHGGTGTGQPGPSPASAPPRLPPGA